MQDDDGRLVEAIARAIKERCDRSPTGYPGEDALARAALSAIEREGWKVVPVEPTEEMVTAMHSEVDDLGRHFHRILYRAALSASPKQGK